MSDENNKRKTRAALVFLLLLEENRGEKMNIGTNKIYDDFASSVEKIFFLERAEIHSVEKTLCGECAELHNLKIT